MSGKNERSLLFKLFGESKGAKGQNIQNDDVAEAASEAATQEPTELERAGLIITDEKAQEEAAKSLLQPAAESAAKAATPVEVEEPPYTPPPDEQNADGTLKPIDAQMVVSIAPGEMEAYIEFYAPRNGGADASPSAVRHALTSAGVTSGILDSAVMGVVMQRPYGRGRILIAQGTPKKDGANGVVTELFPRKLESVPQLNGDGTVDFKQMNILLEIMAGAVICTATAPTPGEDGVTVKCNPAKAVPGKPAVLQKTANTVLSPDGLKLSAGANGHLIYKDGKFQVETVFTVDESVDNNTGNISFCGDVVIKGDVREGYEIRSQGNVTVKGTVEGGSIFADGDVMLMGGFNGMKRGEVNSQKSITSKFLQNCTVYAKTCITTETIINSVVECDGQVVCTKGKGTIVGGRITALHTVEANTIGSDVNTPTQITVGLSPTIIAERVTLEAEMRDVEEGQESLRKNLIYLERCAKMGPLSPKNMTLVETCNKQKVLTLVRESKAKRRLTEVNALIEEAAAGSWVKARVVYPSTKITIQNFSLMTKDVYNRAMFRRDEGEIKFSTF